MRLNNRRLRKTQSQKTLDTRDTQTVTAKLWVIPVNLVYTVRVVAAHRIARALGKLSTYSALRRIGIGCACVLSTHSSRGSTSSSLKSSHRYLSVSLSQKVSMWSRSCTCSS